MFGIGETELVLILLFAFMLFGPDKLPGMGRTIGRALRQFREAQEGFTKVVQTEIVDPINKAADDPEVLLRRRKAISEDSDIDEDNKDRETNPSTDGANSEPSAKRESFAERRARLQAEAAEAVDASTAATERAEASAEQSAASANAPAASAEPSAANAESSAVDDAPTMSVAALYGLTSSADQAPATPDEAADDAQSTTHGKEA